MQLQARDKRALIGGAAALVLLLAFLLWPRGGGDSNVQLVPAEERGAAPPSTTNPAPMPPAAAAPALAAGPAQPTPGAVPEGLKLTGIAATGAIFAFPDGSQRLVRRGREVAPGLVLQETRVREVLLSSGPALLRMSFSGPATPVQPPAAPVPVATLAPSSPPPDRNMFR